MSLYFIPKIFNPYIINNPYAKLCIPDFVKNMNIEVFNLMSKTNETYYVSWHITCACKCRLDELFVMIDSVETVINPDVNVKN